MENQCTNVIIFGASRGVGRCLVDRALAHGHYVTAAVRDTAAMTLTHERLRVLPCDVLNGVAVNEALAGQDVAFCTLGTHRGPTTLYSAGATTLVRGMRAAGTRRLVLLSNFGVLGETAQDARGAALLLLARLMLRHTLADHRRALDAVRKNVPEWVAVRPLPLTNGPWTGRYRISVDGLPRKGIRIARADVADFMLRQATSDEFLGKVPAIAY